MNSARGEAAIEIGGQVYAICLTLGALAEIESAFQCNTMSDLQARLQRLSGAEVLIVLQALLRGGGTNLPDEGVKAVSPGAAIKAIGEAFHAALV